MTEPQSGHPTWTGMDLRSLAPVLAFLLVGCVSGVESTEATSSADTVDDASRHLRADVTGLLGGGLVLEDPVAGTVSAGGDGVVVFPNALATGGTYSLAIALQPIGPKQTCTVKNGGGTVGETDPVVAVTCEAPLFTVGGHASGVDAVGLVLAANGTESVALSSDGTFRFRTELSTGASYDVTVTQQPRGQSCRVYFASGTVAAEDVTNVEVVCEDAPKAVAEAEPEAG